MLMTFIQEKLEYHVCRIEFRFFIAPWRTDALRGFLF